MERFVHWYILPTQYANASCFFIGTLDLDFKVVKITRHPMEDTARIQVQIDPDDWVVAKNFKDVMELYGWIDDSLQK